MSTGSEAFDTSDSTLLPARLPARLPKGFELESYVVDGWVRDGGMAAIYRAHHRSDGTRVALKVQLPATVHLPEICTRFDREAEAMTRVRGSEAIVELLATDHLVDGRRYFVVEWVDGENLEERLDFLRNQDDRLPVARACALGAAIARGLADAHAVGLVHRDLKPANVMVGRDADDELVKLVDFGVVADLHRDPTAEEHDEEVMGTSAYMAPEQAEGAPATPAMDLFALGVVLYEALTGTCVPPDGWTPETLPAVESLRRAVPLELAELVRACMHRDPGARPASATEVAERLAELARHTNANASMISVPLVSEAVRTGQTTITPRAELVALPSEPAVDDEFLGPAKPDPAPLATASAPSDASAPTLAVPVAPVELAVPPVEPDAIDPKLHADAVGESASAHNRTGETEVVLTVESVVARRHATRPPPMATVVAPAVPVAPPRTRRSRAPVVAPRPPRVRREPARSRGLLVLFVVVALLGIGLGAVIALRGGSTEPAAVEAAVPTTRDDAPPEPAPSGSPSAAAPSGPIRLAPDRASAEPHETASTVEPGETPPQPARPEVEAPVDDEAEAEAEPSGPTRAQCARMRAEAETAKASRDWATVVKATKTRACWKGSKALARRRLRVEAFAETRSYSRCVKEGGRSKDPQIVRRVTWCAGRLEG